MHLKAVSDRILIKKDPVAAQTFGDDGQFLLIDEDGTYTAYTAMVVDVGPGRWLNVDGEEVLSKPTVTAGDHIMIAGNAVGHPLPQRLRDEVGEDYAFIFEDEILALVPSEGTFVITEADLRTILAPYTSADEANEAVSSLH